MTPQEIESLKAERDALLQELHKANSIIIDLQRNPPKFTAEYLRDVKVETVLCAVSVCEFTQQIVVDSDSTSYPTVAVCLSEDLIQYAESVRQGGAE